VDGWRTALGGDPVPWLLEAEDPALRAGALRHLLDRPPDDAELAAARVAMADEGVVGRILAAQGPDGHWGQRDAFYRDKYRGTVWQLVTLAAVGADGADPRVRAGCEALLRDAQDVESGGFAYDRARAAGGGRHSEVIPCLTGNLVWALVSFGLLDDPRVRRGIDWITTYQRFDTGDAPRPRGWPYDGSDNCWGRHTCHMGAVKAIKALAAIPPERRTPAVENTLTDGVEYVLRHHVHKRCHDPSAVAKPGWLRFGFPLMYQDDVLEVLRILTSLGKRDPRMHEAIAVVVGKADGEGRLTLEQTFNDRFLVRVEVKGKPSRWLTLEALRMLKAA
jgi:hypothetical protein